MNLVGNESIGGNREIAEVKSGSSVLSITFTLGKLGPCFQESTHCRCIYNLLVEIQIKKKSNEFIESKKGYS